MLTDNLIAILVLRHSGLVESPNLGLGSDCNKFNTFASAFEIDPSISLDVSVNSTITTVGSQHHAEVVQKVERLHTLLVVLASILEREVPWLARLDQKACIDLNFTLRLIDGQELEILRVAILQGPGVFTDLRQNLLVCNKGKSVQYARGRRIISYLMARFKQWQGGR